MILQIYALKDNATGEFIFFFQSQNDNTALRVIKGALLDKGQNPFITDMKDKDVYSIGEIDTMTGDIVKHSPILFKRVSDIRLDLIKEIKIAKAEMGEKDPNADEVAKDE